MRENAGKMLTRITPNTVSYYSLQLKSITQYFQYHLHGNMGNNDDVLSQNLQVMEIRYFQVKKGYPSIHQPRRKLKQ